MYMEFGEQDDDSEKYLDSLYTDSTVHAGKIK